MLNRSLPALPGDVVLLLGRVILGGVLFAHGWHKVMIEGIAGTSGEFERLGIPLAILSASFAAFVEFVGGVLLVVGALTTTVVALDLVVMVGAAVFVHLTHGIVAGNGGLELVVVIVAAELVLVANGPGRFSVDEWILQVRRRREAGVGARVAGVVTGVVAPSVVTPQAQTVAPVGRPVGGGPVRAPGWVSGSWADGFDGEPTTSPDGRAVPQGIHGVTPVGPTHPQPVMRPEPGAPWGVWRPIDDVVAAGDRRNDTAGGATQKTDTATGAGPRPESSGSADGGGPQRVGTAVAPVDGAGPVGGSQQAAVPSIPSTRDGDARSLVVGGVGVAGGDRRTGPAGAPSPGPTSRGAGSGASFWAPTTGPAMVAPRRPAGAAPEAEAEASGEEEASGRVEETTAAARLSRSPRVDGMVPSPTARVGAGRIVADRLPVPVPVLPAAPDGAAASAAQPPAAAESRPPAATTGLHRRPAEPTHRRPATTPVAAEIFRPVTEGVLPPAASYPHPGNSPDPISRSVRAYAPQPSAPTPLAASARTVAPETADAGPGLPSTPIAERAGASSGRGPAASGTTAAVLVGSFGGQAGAIGAVLPVGPAGTARGLSGLGAVVRRPRTTRAPSPALPATGEPTPFGVPVQAPLDFTPTTAIPVSRPTMMLQGLHQSADYQPTPTEALPRTSPPEKTIARRPSPRPSAAGSSR